MNTETIETLGLSNTEAKVYLALLGLKDATANQLSEESGIHRRTVYDALETLVEKGLVTFSIGINKKTYNAEKPDKFLEILEDKKKAFLQALPELLAKIKNAKEEQEAVIYRGKNGIKNIMEDLIKERKTVYLFGSGGLFKEFFGDLYSENWFSKAIKKKIKIKAIYGKDAKKTIKKYPNQESRFILEKTSLPSSTIIYGEKVAIIIYSEIPLGILIKSKKAAESYLSYFNSLWELSRV